MKYLFLLFAFFCVGTCAFAQIDTSKQIGKKNIKPFSIGLHHFYNDFVTPQHIKSVGMGDVVKNNLWNKPSNMQGGFGIDALYGFTKNVDAVLSVNLNSVDYILPSSLRYGSSHLMLDVNAGMHLKLFSDRHIFSPFFITKAGFLSFQNIKGFNLQPGLGLQVNLFQEAFLFTNVEYRIPMSSKLSSQLFYSVGIAANIFKAKKVAETDRDGDGIADGKDKCPDVVGMKQYKGCPAPDKDGDGVIDDLDKCPELAGVKDNDGCPKKNAAKMIAVTVLDEATSKPLQYVAVSLIKSDGSVFSAITDDDGKVIFKDVAPDNYTISGRLNKIDATSVNLSVSQFDTSANQLLFRLTHNDPRFTLVGKTVDKTLGKPVGGINVSITNATQSSTVFLTSRENDGEFRVQLESASDFSIYGKKEGYISNIENLSTKGLNRSATLYVKLELGIENAEAGRSIVLNKIFFATGKSDLNTKVSSDLFKLIQFLKDNPATKLEIQGYTDNVGNAAKNVLLSKNRASSVITFLINNGVNITQLTAKGYGAANPIGDNSTPEGRTQNRRVEMRVLE